MIRIALALSMISALHAGVGVDIEAFGKSLGGWKAKDKSACDYDLSGSGYRTYKPELTPTPDGGVFASIRIDHRRGWLASDDHAVLELTIGKDGSIISAQSNLALQGRTISSDVIRTGGSVGGGVPGVGAAVKVGADLTADLSSKLLREKVVEPGRVNFPAAVRHNYNLLFQAIRSEGAATAQASTAGAPAAGASPAPAAAPTPATAKAAPATPPATPTPAPAPAANPAPAEPKKEDAPPATDPAKPAAPTAAKLEIRGIGQGEEIKK